MQLPFYVMWCTAFLFLFTCNMFYLIELLHTQQPQNPATFIHNESIRLLYHKLHPLWVTSIITMHIKKGTLYTAMPWHCFCQSDLPCRHRYAHNHVELLLVYLMLYESCFILNKVLLYIINNTINFAPILRFYLVPSLECRF